MSHKQATSEHQDILELIQANIEEIKQAYVNRSDQQSMDLSTVLSILDDVASIINADVSNVKRYISDQSGHLPFEYNIRSLNFKQFIELVRHILQTEANFTTNDVLGNILGGVTRGREDPNKKEISELSIQIPTKTYEENKGLLESLLANNGDKLRRSFEVYVEGKDDPEINIDNLFSFLQECFSDEIKLLYVDPRDGKNYDFFKALDSDQKLLAAVEQYCVNVKMIEAFDASTTTLAYNDCFDLIEYWCKTTDELLLVDETEPSKSKQDDTVKRTLKETIKTYEKLLESTKNEADRKVLVSSIQALNQKIAQLEKQTKDMESNRSKKTREERRSLALKEIYTFYCKQQMAQGKIATFEKIKNLSNNLTVGKMMFIIKHFIMEYDVTDYITTNDKEKKIKFLQEQKEYKEKLHHTYIVERFKRDCINYESISYEEFQDFLSKLAIERLYPDSTQYITSDDKKEAFWEKMGLYDGSYKKRMKLLNTPFACQEKEDFRIAPIKYQFKINAGGGKTPEEVQEELRRRNELRKSTKEHRIVEKQHLKQFRSPSVPAIRTEPKVIPAQRTPINSYAQVQLSKNKYVVDPEYNKLTLKKIEAIAGPNTKALENDFNPHDLIDDNDEEDDIYLAQYSIQPEKLRRQQQEINNKKQLEDYGVMSKPSPNKALDRSYNNQNNQSRTENNILGRRNTDGAANLKDVSPGKSYRSVKMNSIMSNQQNMYAGVSQSQDMKAMPRGNSNAQLPSTKHFMYQYYDRANEVENQARKKENDHLSHLINVHDAYLKKGMIVVTK